jgi:hypothetical protein
LEPVWDYEERQAPIYGGSPEVEDVGPCKTKVRFKASAAYPFPPFGIDGLSAAVPNINYDVTFEFEVTAKDQVTVSLLGSHNRFPDYEAYADANLFYKYFSGWSGPNLINLGLTWRNIPTGTKYVINGIEVPPCCPSSNR